MRKTTTKDGLPKNAKLPDILFIDERMRYLSVVDTFEDLLFARLGMYSGLRLNEILNLTPKGIVFSECFVNVLGKGNKERYVPLDYTTLQVLHCIINDKGIELEDKLFTVTSRTMQNRVEAYAKKAEIDRIQVTPHVFRNTCASLILYREIPVQIVQKILGHADISTTKIYFHITPNIVISSYYQAFWEGLL